MVCQGLGNTAVVCAMLATFPACLADHERKSAIRDEILSLQLPDGGCSLAGMPLDWPEFKRKDGLKPSTEECDAYATGMVVWLAVEAGAHSSDDRVRKGVAWLKSHQRESGRWFTPSPTKDSMHYITNSGTALAVLALHATGEIPPTLASIPWTKSK